MYQHAFILLIFSKQAEAWQEIESDRYIYKKSTERETETKLRGAREREITKRETKGKRQIQR